MAWEQLWITKPHIAYAIIGGFTTIFSLCSLFVKEKLYIGEATVATIVGIIFGPHALNWFNPGTWGNVDYITLELSRIVLIVQIFAVAVELPKKYMLRHWVSVFMLLMPVMIAGWLISSCFIWKLIPSLTWVEALVVAACITATDPVLASAVVGKGKFSKRVPGHLRNLLSAESGSNDGMAFPFTYLSLYLIRYAGNPSKIFVHWFTLTVLYECLFGCVLGCIIGYSGRHLIKFAEKHNLIDRESFLVFYFVLALFCTGVGSILGTDDLLVSFAAGAAFAWDGWFTHKTEESHVSNVIDLLLNLAYFVYFGSIIPWQLYNSPQLGITPWKLVILAILIILFRRIPIMLMLKPVIPDIRTWREALFCGHFGPIGVGAIFTSILARAELEHDEPTPLAELPSPGSPNYMVVAVIWPVVTFLIIASIIVHGSSIAVFTLGKRLNTMAITMSYTTGNGNGPSWLQRLPRMETGQSLSFRKVETQGESTGLGRLFGKSKQNAAQTEIRPPPQAAGRMTRRRPRRNRPEDATIQLGDAADYEAGTTLPDELVNNFNEEALQSQINPAEHNFYQEGSNLIIEDSEGEVLTTINSLTGESQPWKESNGNAEPQIYGDQSRRQRIETSTEHDGTRAIAYQLDDEIIVENEEGEVIRRYRINRHRRPSNSDQNNIYDRALSWVGLRRGSAAIPATPGSSTLSTQQPDLEMHRIDTVSSSTASAIEKGDLPKNFLQRRTSTEVVNPDTRHDWPENDEETPAERKRRLAALGSTSDDYKMSYNDDYDESPAEQRRRLAALQSVAADDDDNESAPGLRTPKDRTPRISFAGETEVERRRRMAALGFFGSDGNSPESSSSASEREQNEPPKGISWSANIKPQ
ncbi:Sodium/hydrogen exchanger family-domain-containing protein [Lipomyces japonicus]|uniref:Sodium/hydrogen exchanger family-domain-containing protein n=1 Tax=Lipomyces japonicus TaxID=56871 RepID=UPI0034CEBDA9